MPRDLVAITAMTLNAKNDEPTGTTINVTNGAYLDPDGDVMGLIIEVNHTTVSAKNLTVKAGAYPPSWAKGLGDLVIALTASKITKICIEGARFVQADGTVNIDFESGTTGTIKAYRLPKTAR